MKSKYENFIIDVDGMYKALVNFYMMLMENVLKSVWV